MYHIENFRLFKDNLNLVWISQNDCKPSTRWLKTHILLSKQNCPDVDIGWNCHAWWKYPVWTRGTFLDNSTLPSFQSTTPTTWVTSFNWLVFAYPVIACAYHSCLFKFPFFTSNSFPIQSYGIYCVCRPLRLVYFH